MDKENARIKYADIIDLPHHQSSTRKHMTLYDRAAQFASYRALSGYEDMVEEEARRTDSEIELSDSMIELINATIAEIKTMLDNGASPRVSVTRFIPDKYKSGGEYSELTGIIKKIDPISKKLVFYGSDDTEDKRIPAINIPIDKIISISIIAG